jgi:hypothetical protein
MADELKMMYGLIGMLMASGMLTYLTRGSDYIPYYEPDRRKKGNKKKKYVANDHLQLMEDDEHSQESVSSN